MARYLRQSVAATIVIGPFVNSTNGYVAETALTISAADVLLSKNGAAFAAANAAATHMTNGYYSNVLSTGNTDTLGRLTVIVSEAGALPVRLDYIVLDANTFDSLIGGTDKLQIDAVQHLGTAYAAPTTAGVPEVDVTFAGGVAVTSESGTAAAVALGTITLATGASAEDNVYNGWQVTVTSSTTGAKQTRQISGYVGATRVATLSANWSITPTGTLVYDLAPDVPSSGSGLDAAGVRSAIGLATANLDTQLVTIDDFLDTEVTDIRNRLPAALVSGRIDASVGAMAAGVVTAAAIATDAIDADALSADALTEIFSKIWTTALTEAYAADGVAPTGAQAVFLIQQMLTEMGIVSTTMTVKKLDGTTTAATFTLNSATAPTSLSRTT